MLGGGGMGGRRELPIMVVFLKITRIFATFGVVITLPFLHNFFFIGYLLCNPLFY